MMYGAKVVLLAKIPTKIVWVQAYIPEDNEVHRASKLDLMEEKQATSFTRMERSHNHIYRMHNKQVVPRSFQVGDLILRKF